MCLGRQIDTSQREEQTTGSERRGGVARRVRRQRCLEEDPRARIAAGAAVGVKTREAGKVYCTVPRVGRIGGHNVSACTVPLEAARVEGQRDMF